MRTRVIALGLAAACVVCGIVAFVFFVGQDHTPPVITVEKLDISYKDGDDQSALLAGVTAEDNVDGDLTDQIFVDRIVATGKNEGMVYYGVMDSKKNVATASRKIEYQTNEEEVPNIDTDEEEKDEDTKSKEDASKDAKDKKADEKGADEDEKQQDEELRPDGVNPAISLASESLTVKAGGTFNVVNVIDGMVDDKDTLDQLSRMVMVNGTYDTNVPGTYPLEIFVVDSDGNASEAKAFTLIVE